MSESLPRRARELGLSLTDEELGRLEPMVADLLEVAARLRRLIDDAEPVGDTAAR